MFSQGKLARKVGRGWLLGRGRARTNLEPEDPLPSPPFQVHPTTERPPATDRKSSTGLSGKTTAAKKIWKRKRDGRNKAFCLVGREVFLGERGREEPPLLSIRGRDRRQRITFLRVLLQVVQICPTCAKFSNVDTH